MILIIFIFCIYTSCLPSIYVEFLRKQIPEVYLIPALRDIQMLVQSIKSNDLDFSGLLMQKERIVRILSKHCASDECHRICSLVIEAIVVECFGGQPKMSVLYVTIKQQQLFRMIQTHEPIFYLKEPIEHTLLYIRLYQQLSKSPSFNLAVMVIELKYEQVIKTWIRRYAEYFSSRIGFHSKFPGGNWPEWYREATKQTAPKLSTVRELNIFIGILLTAPLSLLKEKPEGVKYWKQHYLMVIINLAFVHQRILELQSTFPRSDVFHIESSLKDIYKELHSRLEN